MQTVFFGTVKKVVSTQKPDQSGRMEKHVQITIETTIGEDVAEDMGADLLALQDTSVVRFVCEPQDEPKVQDAEAPADGLVI